MAELEQEEIVDDIETDVEIEEQETSNEDITIDDYNALLERNKKAEKKLVELKKQAKVVEKTPQNGEDVRAILAEEKFYEKNPEAESYRKEIEGYVVKGITRKQALLITSEKDNEVEKTREVYGKSLVGNNAGDELSVMSIDTFDKMTPTQQDDYSNKMTSKYGKIKFK